MFKNFVTERRKKKKVKETQRGIGLREISYYNNI